MGAAFTANFPISRFTVSHFGHFTAIDLPLISHEFSKKGYQGIREGVNRGFGVILTSIFSASF